MRSSVALYRLVLEEAKALPRGRFVLAGAAVLACVLVLVGGFVATGIDGLWSFAIIAYGMAPALFAGFAAAQIAGLRATRFGQAIFTTPVRAGEVLAAKILISLGVALLYFAATLPFLGVASLHLDVPPKVHRFALAGFGLLVFSVIFGTMLGILLPGRAPAAPVALGTGSLVLSFFAMPYAWTKLSAPLASGSEGLRMMHLSPHLLLDDATGVTAAHAGFAAASPGRALSLLAIEVLACLAIAAWAYTRAQGPEAWEASPGHRAILAGLAVLILVLPAAAADVEYERIPGPSSSGRGWSSEARNGTFTLVEPGGGVPSSHDPLAGTAREPLAVDEVNSRDLLIWLATEKGLAVRNASFTVEAGGNLVVEAPQAASTDVMLGTDGRALLRTPVTLTPSAPQDLTSNHYPIWINVTYILENGETREAKVAASVRADVPGARLQMFLAGTPMFVMTAAAAVTRRLSVGGG